MALDSPFDLPMGDVAGRCEGESGMVELVVATMALAGGTGLLRSRRRRPRPIALDPYLRHLGSLGRTAVD